jgi:hypothetical protein
VLRTHSQGFESHSRISFGAFIEREVLMKRSCVLAASVTRKNRITRSVVGIAYTAKFRKRFEGNAKEGAKDRLRSPLASAILPASRLMSTGGFERRQLLCGSGVVLRFLAGGWRIAGWHTNSRPRI